jgi:mRNA interferase RelE/StbE
VRYRVTIKRSAEKELDRIGAHTQSRILTRISDLQEQPRPEGSEKLQGQENYRIRIGDYRVIYTVHDREKLVEIIKIGNRKEIYKKR